MVEHTANDSSRIAVSVLRSTEHDVDHERTFHNFTIPVLIKSIILQKNTDAKNGTIPSWIQVTKSALFQESNGRGVVPLEFIGSTTKS